MKFSLLVGASLGVFSWGWAFAQSPPQPYEYMRGEYEVPCPDDETQSCIWHRLVVDNQTAATLECRAHIAFDGVDRNKAAKAEHPMVIEPKTRRTVLGDTTTPDVKATSHSVDCVARKPLDNSKLTPDCKPTFTDRPTAIDYPNESRTAGEEGQVVLEFSLSNKEGAPTEITVVGSSLWPKLDESAKKYVGKYVGSTECKKGRFRIPVNFRLQ
jgi:TonB family protein